MRGEITLMITCVAMLMSCARMAEKKMPANLTADAVRIDTGTYRVCIHIPRTIKQHLDHKTIENLIYRPDSSIYLQSNLGKVYPLYIEPVASGSSQQIVYMVAFNDEKVAAQQLFYADKYINHQIYPLKLR